MLRFLSLLALSLCANLLYIQQSIQTLNWEINRQQLIGDKASEELTEERMHIFACKIFDLEDSLIEEDRLRIESYLKMCR